MAGSAQAGSWRELPARLEPAAAVWGGSVQALDPVPGVPAAKPAACSAPEDWARYGVPTVVELSPLLDTVWRKGVVFQAGPATVHISGMKSVNGKKNWFLTVWEEGAEAPRFINGRSIVHYRPFFSPVPLMDGSAMIEVGQRRYKLTIEGQLINRSDSRLRVEPQDKSERRSEWKVRKVADAAFESGTPITLRGEKFRLLYTRNILEDDDGGFKGFAGDWTLVFMTVENGEYVAYGFSQAEVPVGSVGVFSQAPAGEDCESTRPLRVGLRLDGAGNLEVYDLEGKTALR